MQMQTLGRFCLLIFLHHYNKFLRFSLQFFLFMDFPSTFNFLTQASELGCGFVLLGYVSRLFNFIGLVLIFGICLKILKFSDAPRFWKPPKEVDLDKNLKSAVKCDDGVVGLDEKDKEKEKEKEEDPEDEVFDVMSLRRMVKMERHRYFAACAEIEKERVAASSAAEEAMAMILRLQSEKSSIEIQANQFRRMVEERQEYDQEVIESLRWNVVQLENQKTFLEEQLGVFKEKLREFMKDEEIELIEGADFTREFCNFSVEYDVDDSHQSHHDC
ncbi:probable myosin-binding protein 5 [Trifolium pratense]|uniref:Uncharacterized protein n=1 Tax=Trifolium pratense TaxID=57577 RepID=A0ACB0JUT1_TRIPR|nr:probable myosin-binding protein 5 [Trifolium pratense]CAJ2648877.1 unnamed protein product [Trifolium pratense]